MKHTPGPWRYEKETQTLRSVPSNYWLATFDSFDGAIKKQTEANATLIAAAPDLLEAARQAMDIISSYRHIPAQAKAERILFDAIAKAEGK